MNAAYGDAPKASAPRESDKPKRLWLNVSGMEEEDVEELLETLTFYAGDTEVFFVQDGKKMRCSEKVSLNKALMAELSSFLPENCIKVVWKFQKTLKFICFFKSFAIIYNLEYKTVFGELDVYWDIALFKRKQEHEYEK